jgi:hypothetical protein
MMVGRQSVNGNATMRAGQRASDSTKSQIVSGEVAEFGRGC